MLDMASYGYHVYGKNRRFTFFWSLWKAHPKSGSKNGVKAVSMKTINHRSRLRRFKTSGNPCFHLILSLLYINGFEMNYRSKKDRDKVTRRSM